MLNLSDITASSVTPISKITPVLAVDPIGTLAQTLGDRAAQFIKGQEYTAQVLSHVGDGTYVVKLESVDHNAAPKAATNVMLKMDLGQLGLNLTEKTGQTLLLRSMSDGPSPTFLALANTNNSAGSSADISATAKLIANVLNQADAEGVSSRFEATNIVTQMPHQAHVVAHDLKNAVSNSGLFYESHLNDLMQHQHTIAAIRQEPQNQANAPLTGLMAQQLAILEHQRLSWQGPIWLGQKMDWDVYFQKDAAEHQHSSAYAQREPLENRPIASELHLHLPHLGKVSAKLTLADGRMRIALLAEQAQTLNTLKNQRQQLAQAIEKNGQQLDALTVARHDV